MAFHLSFADHVHNFDSRQDDAGAPEVLEAHHRPDDPLDCAVVLLYDVVQIFVLPDLDGSFPFGVHGFERLMVADASVFPDMVVNNINLTCHAIGEKGADLARARLA